MLTHVDAANRPTMVDVGDKAVTTRTAAARAIVVFPRDALVRSGEVLRTKKGPVFDTAIIAGVMAAKRTHELIPFCHPLALEDCRISIEWGGEQRGRHRVLGARDAQDRRRDGSAHGRDDGRADRLRHVQGAHARDSDSRDCAAVENRR